MLRFQNKIPVAISIGGKIVEKIKMNDEVVWGRVQTPLYVQNTYNGTNTISVKQTLTGSPDSGAYAKYLEFSKDGVNWTKITLSSTAYTISLAKNEKVYFRGNEGVFNYWTSGGSQKAITTISASQNHTVGGNINSLLDYTDPYGLILPQGAFNSMFENDTKLTSASDLTLPSSSDGSLSTYAYTYMFKGCSSLTTAPQSIPAKVQGQDACNGMFANCTSLTAAPQLPATTLAAGCYWSLFEGCTSLTVAPQLPATTLATSCYRSLFQGCTALVLAPQLPATTLANNCYQALFRGCSSLTTAPSVIPATTAPYLSCQRMFSDCVSLKSAPELPATTVESGSYQYMFYNCKKLTKAPTELPATTLKLNSYYSMFELCSKLTTPPVIKATTFAENSCAVMFRSCSSLNNITVCANDISATNCTQQWLRNVASSGTFNNYGSATYTTNSESGIPTGWIENKDSNNYFYIENTYNGTNKIYLKTLADVDTVPTEEFATSLQYSKDKKNWTTITLNYKYASGSSASTTITNLTLSLAAGEKVYFRNTSGYFSYFDSGTHAHMFSSDESIKAGGNIKSLLDYRNMNGTTLKKGCFYRLFSGADELTDASELILGDTVLADYCYMHLFENCYSLTSVPSLPATTLAKQCYLQMFKGTAITSAPALPATNLAPYCYKNIFENCYSLTSAPNLPATTLSTACYQGMFNGCYNLTTAPVLRATTLAEYSYRYMFNGCLKLNSVTTYANDISANECTRWWLENVAATGIVHNFGSATYTKNSSDGIPSGWTELKNS